MRNTNKKGFTIVELVVVVAVIAILAAVLIPTFSGIIAKAQLSADQVAVKNMNTALAAGSADVAAEDLGIEKIEKILTEAGFNMENGVNALRSGYAIYWFKNYNTIVLAEGDKVIYPTNNDKLVADFKVNYADTSKVYDLRKLVDGSSVVVNGEIVGSLKDALIKGGEVTLFNDVVATEKMIINKNTTLNLNGHNISFTNLDGSSTSGRLFNIENDGATLIINAEGSTINFGCTGLVAMKGNQNDTIIDVKVVINGGTFIGSTNGGAFIKAVRNVNATVELNNVTYTDNTNSNANSVSDNFSYIVGSNKKEEKGTIVSLKVNGGTYNADAGFGDFVNGEFKNVTINSRGYGIYGINYTIENSTIVTSSIHVNGSTPTAAIAMSGSGTVTVTNSTLNASEGNAIDIYSGNSTVTITNCTITGNYHSWEGNSTVTVNGVNQPLN